MLILDVQKIKFPSKPESKNIVERFVDEVCDYFNVSNDYFGNIIVTVLEAVDNAIMHGNKNDSSKNVILSFEAKPEGLCFTIQDEGTGFDVSSIPDPTDPANEDINKGRGIYLLKSLADEVRFLENGSIVELYFKIANINNRMANHRMEEFMKHKTEKQKETEKEKKIQ